MTGAQPASDVTLWLDALDEYRTGGNHLTRFMGSPTPSRPTKVPRWRLSCRSEDWRKGADVAPVRDTTAGAQNSCRAAPATGSYRSHRRPGRPRGRCARRVSDKSRGSWRLGFIESPLSLKLLRKAVAGGDDWPTTRFDLLDVRRSAASSTSTTTSIGGLTEARPTTSSQPPVRPAWFSLFRAPVHSGGQMPSRRGRLVIHVLT